MLYPRKLAFKLMTADLKAGNLPFNRKQAIR